VASSSALALLQEKSLAPFQSRHSQESTAVWQHPCFPYTVPTLNCSLLCLALLSNFWYAAVEVFLEMEVSHLNGKYSVTSIAKSRRQTASADAICT